MVRFRRTKRVLSSWSALYSNNVQWRSHQQSFRFRKRRAVGISRLIPKALLLLFLLVATTLLQFPVSLMFMTSSGVVTSFITSLGDRRVLDQNSLADDTHTSKSNVSSTMDDKGGIVDCQKLRLREEKHDSTLWVPTSTEPSFQMSIHNPIVDKYISASIAREGCFECGALQLAMAALDEHADSILIDVGSNIGMYALTAAAKGHDVFAFEPVERNYARMCQTMRANPRIFGFPSKEAAAARDTTTAKLTLIRRAVTSTSTIVTIDKNAGRGNYGAFKVSEITKKATKEEEEGKQSWQEGEDYAVGVPLDVLADHIPANQNRPIVLKVDVEGFECAALAGGLDFLGQQQIHYVSIEMSWQRLQGCGDDLRQDIFDLFFKNGLRPYKWSDRQSAFEELDPFEWQSTWVRSGSHNPRMDLFDVFWSKKNPIIYNTTFYNDMIRSKNQIVAQEGNQTKRVFKFSV
ncbi:hypothetical protein ACA910_017684 [Epithemia clementina (nom. ined.)]